jgi:hypothetical protein
MAMPTNNVPVKRAWTSSKRPWRSEAVAEAGAAGREGVDIVGVVTDRSSQAPGMGALAIPMGCHRYKPGF